MLLGNWKTPQPQKAVKIMNTFNINLSMNQLDAALVKGSNGNCAGHRGLWFYDPSNYDAEIRTGDIVVFRRFDEVVAVGKVTQLCLPGEVPKVCSRINSRGFRWRDLTADEISDLQLDALVGACC